MPRLPVFLQIEACECGLASLAMVTAYHDSDVTLAQLRNLMPVSRKGVTVRGIVEMADAIGVSARAVKLDLDELPHLALPAILHWDMDHFVVLRSVSTQHVVIHDPAVGARRVSMKEFGQRFTGVAIECAPSPSFNVPASANTSRLRQWLSGVPKLRRGLLGVLGLTALLEVLAISMPLLIQWIVDDALPANNVPLIDGLVAGFALLVIVGASMEIARGWLATLASTDLNLHWSSRVLAHLLRLPLQYFERRHVGDIASCFGSIATIQRTFTTGFIEAIADGAMALGTLAMMAYYSTSGAQLAITVVVIYAIVSVLLQRPMRQATAEQIIQAARQQSHFLETMRGMQSVRLYGCAEERHRGWFRLLALQTNMDLKIHGLRLSHETANQVLFGLQRVFVVWIAAHAVLGGTATVGLFFAFLAYLDQFTRRSSTLIDRVLDLSLLRLHVERVGDIVNTTPEESEPNNLHFFIQQDELNPPPRITLRDLTFSYAFCESPVLDGIDLHIRSGECIALTGPSGCGKTTLVKILLGLLEPNNGSFEIDGEHLHEFGQHRWRAMAGTVMQDDMLFSGSIADNICFFDADPDIEFAQQCARMASVHDDIEAMPMGYSTLVGESGIGVSGGQKQRIMLARALYRRPRILVLDEATSHLDVKAEHSVNSAVANLELTRVIVAHRPETIAMADRVIEINNGRVVREYRPERREQLASGRR